MKDAPTTPPQTDLPLISHAIRIALIYALFGGTWIVVTDRILNALSLDSRLQTFKGWFYIALTTVALYLFLREGARRLRRWQTALEASQESYAAFLSATPDLMFELTREGTFISYKPASMGLNQPAEAFMGHNIRDVLPQIGQQTLNAIEQAFSTGELQVFCYQLPLKGELHDYEARIVARRPDSAIAIVRDITDRQRTEEALQRANRAYRLLSDCNQIMVRASDEMTLLHDICRIVVASGQFSLAWVGYAHKDEARTIEPVASFGIEDGYLRLIQGTWADEPRGRGPSGRAIRSGKPVVIADCATHPDFEPWRSAALARGYRSALSLPLTDSSGVFGVLAVYADETNAFHHAEEVTLLAELANDLAYGITALRTRAERERAREAEHIQRTLAEALSDTAATAIATRDPDAVMDRILANMRQSVPHDAANIMLIENGRARVVRDSGHSNPPSPRAEIGWLDRLSFDVQHNHILRRVVETRQPLIVTDTAAEPEWQPHPATDWLRAYACAPIARDDQVIGFLNVYSSQSGFFTEPHLPRLQAFADQAALALYNVELFAAERDQRALAEALQDTATIINSTLDLDVVTDRILDNLKRVVPHDSASLMLIDDGVGRVVRHRGFVERGLGPWLARTRFPIDSMPTLKGMFDTREPIVIANTATHPDWVAHPEVGWIRSYAAAPIHRDGSVIGYLQVESAWPNFFSTEHAARLKTFADQAAIAIQNAQLYQAAQQDAVALHAHAQRLALLNRISNHIAHQLDLDKIYHTVLLELQAALNASFGGLVLFENDEIGRLVLGTHPDEAVNDDITIGVKHNPSIDIVRETHKPLVSEDVLNDPVFEPAWEALRKRGTRTLLIMPLIVGDDVIGTLGFDWVEPRQFTPEELELVETIANQASVAITKAQLYTAERDQRILAEALGHVAALSNRSLALDDLLDGLLDTIGRVISYDAGNIMLFDHNVAEIVRYAGYKAYGPSEQILGLRLTAEQAPHWARLRSGEHAQPYIIEDTHGDPEWHDLPESHWIRACLKAPISIENKVVGLLNLDSATPHHFTSFDAERLQAFADQVALAIQNARLFQAEREQRTLAEALRAAAAAVSSTLQFDMVLDRILANVGQVLPHDAANIMLIEDGVARVARGYGYAEHGAGNWIAQLRFAVDEIPVWQDMLATQRPFAISDTHAEPLWLRLPEEAWICSTVKAPIVLEDRVIGILHLDSAQSGFFEAKDAERLQAFADQAAIAIRNAQLYDAVQLHASVLEQRVGERTAEVEAQRAQLQAVLDSMGEAVIFTRGSDVMYVNAAFTALLGYEATELMHRPFDIADSLLAPGPEADRLGNAIRASLTQSMSWRGEVAAMRCDGTPIDTALTITQVPGLDGEDGAGFVAIFRDISQEKALQAQKDRFIAHASHELRTPLANVKTRLYLLRKQPEKLQAHLEVINRVTDNMTELIENLLDISRFERGIIPLYQRPVALAELIEEVIAIQRPEAEDKDILLRGVVPDLPLITEADPQRIVQVITNLVINAINYTEEGGQIMIELVPVEPSAAAPCGQAMIRVRDNGIGIPQDLLSQVFEPFFRTNEGMATGTGLGLTIAREIVHLHHGSLTVDSEVGQGTVFTVTLDLLDSSHSR